MTTQQKKLTVIALTLSLMAIGCSTSAAPAAPTPIPPDAVVLAATEGWNSDNVGAGQIDATLAYFADDAVFKMVGMPPEIPDTYTGKQAIRAAFESWLPLHPRLQVEVLKVEGDTVTAQTLYWSDAMRAMGVAPLEGTDVYVVRDGLIVNETWTLTDESSSKLKAAFAAAMAAQAEPTAAPTARPTRTPKATPLPEVLASSIEDIVGVWKTHWSDITTLHLELKANGRFRVARANGDEIETGRFSFEGGRLTWETSETPQGACSYAPTAVYEVYVAKQDGKPVQLRFSLVGEDKCADRKEAFSKVWTPVNP